jgi:hypothetical protein
VVWLSDIRRLIARQREETGPDRNLEQAVQDWHVECWALCLGCLLFFFAPFISLAFSLNGNCGRRVIRRLATSSHPGVLASGFSPTFIGRTNGTKCELYVVLLQRRHGVWWYLEHPFDCARESALWYN